MKLTHEPLLQIQRDLFERPRGMERFRDYLRTLIDDETGDMALPLVAMNPMGKDHNSALLDAWLALDAEQIARDALAEISTSLAQVSGTYRFGLVTADDLHGAWTNRYTTEFSHLFEGRPLYKRGWIVGLLWTSEEPAVPALQDEVKTAVYRLAIITRRGPAQTLREMLDQEGAAMAMAGRVAPSLDADDLDYTRQVLEPYLETTDHPIVMAALFGDAAARELGYSPLGLSHRAGLAWALHEASSDRSRLPYVAD